MKKKVVVKGKIHWETQWEKFHKSVPHQTGAVRDTGENKPNHHPYFPFSYSGVEYEVQGGREWIELNRWNQLEGGIFVNLNTVCDKWRVESSNTVLYVIV
jgi:hypothetical protein